MAFRDWLYQTLTGFITWLAGIADGGLTAIWWYAYTRRANLDYRQTDVENGVRWFFDFLPSILGFVRDWLTSLIIGYVVSPVFAVLRWPFDFVMDRITGLWDGASSHYRPVTYGINAGLQLRDRLLDLVDFAQDLVGRANSFASGLVNSIYQTLVGAINGAIKTLNDWTDWVNKTVWPSVQSLSSGLTDTNRTVAQIYGDVQSIVKNPRDWIWSHLEPQLAELVTTWLNRIWYS